MTARTTRSIRIASGILALLLVALRFASPYLHTDHPAPQHHAALQQHGCPSCDVEATQALDDVAPAVLPGAPLVGAAAIDGTLVVALPSARSLTSFGRAPPSDLI